MCENPPARSSNQNRGALGPRLNREVVLARRPIISLELWVLVFTSDLELRDSAISIADIIESGHY